MHIDLGKYVVTSDSMNIILNECKVTKEGKYVGSTYLKPIKFYSSLGALLRGIIELEINMTDSTVDELQKVTQHIDKVVQQLEQHLKSHIGE